jgi:hypothetical protein
LLAALALLPQAAWAIDDTPANRKAQAERYLEAASPKALAEDMAAQMANNLPVAERENFKTLFGKHFNEKKVQEAMQDALVKHFTADELEALADFYSSPLGKSVMKKFGGFMAEVMPAINAEAIQAQHEARKAAQAKAEGKEGSGPGKDKK